MDEKSPAGVPSKQQKEGAGKPAESGGGLIYIPPLRGAPGGRVGGGTRGVGEEAIRLMALAPEDHTGLTVEKQPPLYWFISKRTALPIEFTLTEKRGIKPLVEKRIPAPETPGVQRIQLSEHGAALQENVLYEWFISIIPDQKRRSKDMIAGGEIQRIPRPPTLSEKLDSSGAQNAPVVFAAAGLWYDAMAAVSTLVDASPDDASPLEQRALLLKQVNLVLPDVK
ncbi:MAG: DUF928 domain-containing protein [Desulfobacterales bacterium]|nr:DUF928 domain-containing protein [Desulfobacterales bacterium]